MRDVRGKHSEHEVEHARCVEVKAADEHVNVREQLRRARVALRRRLCLDDIDGAGPGRVRRVVRDGFQRWAQVRRERNQQCCIALILLAQQIVLLLLEIGGRAHLDATALEDGRVHDLRGAEQRRLQARCRSAARHCTSVQQRAQHFAETRTRRLPRHCAAHRHVIVAPTRALHVASRIQLPVDSPEYIKKQICPGRATRRWLKRRCDGCTCRRLLQCIRAQQRGELGARCAGCHRPLLV